jgi:malate dehydrogenase
MSLPTKLDRKAVTVLITGAGGQIGYSLIFAIARGELLGKDQPINLHLAEVEAAMPKLRAVVMELDDCASPLVQKVVATCDDVDAFAGVDVALLVGACPRTPDMERKDLLAVNARIFERAGALLDSVASKDVKVVVVGNPANTNALIAAEHAPSIPKENFTALTRLDQNRATGAIAKRLGVSPADVKGTIIWGNHSTTQFPDVSSATAGGKPVPEAVGDEAWLRGAFTSLVQNRGKEVIEARGGAGSAASAAHAILEHTRDWLLGSDGATVSMGVYTSAAVGGSYGIPPGLVFSLPLRTYRGGRYEVVEGLPASEYARSRLAVTQAELLEERSKALTTTPGSAAGSGGRAGVEVA